MVSYILLHKKECVKHFYYFYYKNNNKLCTSANWAINWNVSLFLVTIVTTKMIAFIKTSILYDIR